MMSSGDAGNKGVQEVSGLAQEVSQRKWFHSIDLGGGIVTPGSKSPAIHAVEYAAFFDPVDLNGRSVLDIGAWNGAYSFEAKRRGATRVLATDHYAWNHPDICGRDGFELARSVLGLDVESMDIDVPELTPERVGTFDVVMFLGVFYHLFDPIAGLERAAKLTREVLIVESHTDALDIDRPAMIMYPGRELADDPTNWWGPNPACMTALLKQFGFAKVDSAWVHKGGYRAVYHAWRTEAFRRSSDSNEPASDRTERRIEPASKRQKLRRGWRLIREGLGLRRP